MDTNTKKTEHTQGTAIFDGCVKLGSIIGKISFFGLREIWRRRLDALICIGPLTLLLYGLAESKRHLMLLDWILPHGNLSNRFYLGLYKLGFWPHFLFLTSFVVGVGLFSVGLRRYLRWKKHQVALDCIALKNGFGVQPKLLSVDSDGPYRTKLRVLSNGVGLSHYENKKADLEAALGCVVERIRTTDNPQFIEILMATRQIPKVCHYKDVIASATKPYSFVVGESIGGRITQCIRDLPHLLIAGTTGGGKSVFFKQTLLGLLETSPKIQMMILDLKSGVEMKEFAELPNVVLAKDPTSAVKLLRKVKKEMEDRFKYMEEKGYKKIDPYRDKMDIIVVGVDEASVLYTRSSGRGSDNSLVDEARDLTDHIAKLARAAGIHLILATQKVTKETIDTKIQENIGGRMCFRMNTIHGSLNVLDSKAALELPDHPGRAIWASGYDFIEVQAPFVSEDEIKDCCEVIKFEFEKGKRKNFQPTLNPAPKEVPKDEAMEVTTN